MKILLIFLGIWFFCLWALIKFMIGAYDGNGHEIPIKKASRKKENIEKIDDVAPSQDRKNVGWTKTSASNFFRELK